MVGSDDEISLVAVFLVLACAPAAAAAHQDGQTAIGYARDIDVTVTSERRLIEEMLTAAFERLGGIDQVRSAGGTPPSLNNAPGYNKPLSIP